VAEDGEQALELARQHSRRRLERRDDAKMDGYELVRRCARSPLPQSDRDGHQQDARIDAREGLRRRAPTPTSPSPPKPTT